LESLTAYGQSVKYESFFVLAFYVDEQHLDMYTYKVGTQQRRRWQKVDRRRAILHVITETPHTQRSRKVARFMQNEPHLSFTDMNLRM